ncbi:M13 family metallopeptidase [Mycoplasma mycoides]|uniref:M13 family metallopeptidase n=1 Tax=Mycoplasma mycoides TaxID=2102 RepID=UPI000771BEAD|nr:M13-type metalloendopeptidase [Mycoplasma mycoides]AMK56415.1 Neutral endopeptidase [Mycoplasma mycoides subsp. mycoides]QKK61111.1 M13 family peptidase [Mycoplasma mycoides]
MKYNVKDNLFKAINNEWLETAKIPSDRSSTSEFDELDIRNEKIVTRMAKKILQQNKTNKLSDVNLINFANFYKLTSDIEKRNELGVSPLKPYFDEILNLSSLKELQDNYVKFMLRGYELPISFGVFLDFLDSSIQTLYVSIANHILPDKSHYDTKEQKTAFLKSFKAMARKLLTLFIKDTSEINKIIRKALKFDEIIAKYSLTSLQKVRYTELYKPYDYKKIVAKTKNFDIASIVSKVINDEVDKIIFSDDNFALNIDKILNEKNFELIKAWMLIKLVLTFAPYLDEKTRTLASRYSLFVSGQDKVENKNKHALNLALKFFSMPIGVYFGKKQLGAKAKKDVEKMVKHMIGIYKERLKNNTWLSQNTIDKAILKLNTLNAHIGYPTELRPYYSELTTTSNLLIENVLKFNEILNKYNFNQYKQPINKNYWIMTPYQVNAYYHPMYNHIVFPAVILQGAFYSIKHTSSENYGGIGAIIAHEISHAFDNNGANFDEKGCLKMWWTQEDFAKFTDKTKAMINLFEGVETDYGKCNGQLTVSENIADAGGVSCALEAAQKEPDYSAEKFFINWAKVWKAKFKPERAKRLLEQDPHAPAELRANIQANNNEEFVESFNIQPEDKMYIAPEKRVKIW